MSKIFDAIYSKDVKKLKTALDECKDVNQTDELGRLPFSEAVATGFIEGCKVLLEHGADINAQNKDDLGYTLLIVASRNRLPSSKDQLNMINFLLENGADIEGTDKVNGTALIGATVDANKEVVELLLEKGANVDCNDVQGQTPLHYLCKFAKGWGSMKITETVNGVTTEKSNPRFQQHTEVFNLLIEKGADVNKMTNYGFSCIHLCGESNAVEFIKPLIKNGADVNSKNSKNYTPLHAAADNGHLEVCKVLIENGADVNVTDDDGFTPLIGAVLSLNEELVKFLLDKGADKSVEVKISYDVIEPGDTALTVAKKKGLDRVVKFLESST